MNSLVLMLAMSGMGSDGCCPKTRCCPPPRCCKPKACCTVKHESCDPCARRTSLSGLFSRLSLNRCCKPACGEAAPNGGTEGVAPAPAPMPKPAPAPAPAPAAKS